MRVHQGLQQRRSLAEAPALLRYAGRGPRLAMNPANPPYETVLEVAGARHSVTRVRDGEWILIRSPTLAELEAMQESEE